MGFAVGSSGIVATRNINVRIFIVFDYVGRRNELLVMETRASFYFSMLQSAFILILKNVTMSRRSCGHRSCLFHVSF